MIELKVSRVYNRFAILLLPLSERKTVKAKIHKLINCL